MKEKTVIKHVALQYSDKKQAEIFFTEILGLTLEKTFTLTKELSNEIFGIMEEVTIYAYADKETYFEIFITDKQPNHGYEHVCIEINNKEEFVKRCKKYDIKPIFIKKGEKTLLFIKDYNGNLFEIKEKQP